MGVKGNEVAAMRALLRETVVLKAIRGWEKSGRERTGLFLARKLIKD